MSASIATNIVPHSAIPESQLGQPHAQTAHEDAKRHDPTVPADGIPFASPVIKVDNDTGLALLVVRNADTGKEIETYPSRKVVEEYSRHLATSEVDVKAPPAPGATVAANAAAPAPTAPVGKGTSSVSGS